jgi:myo-inositol-1-phosphate synthase
VKKAAKRTERRIGIWIVGAQGNVAACAIAGAAAVARGLTDTAGLVTETSVCAGLPLAPVSAFAFGGWDIRKGTVTRAAADFGRRNGLLTPEFLRGIAADLRKADRDLRPGTLCGASSAVAALADESVPADRTPGDAVERLSADLREFRERRRLDGVVVVNLTSTEPDPGDLPALRSVKAFEKALLRKASEGAGAVPPSVLYAAAALRAGAPFIDFTPAAATGTPVVRALAEQHRLPAMGRDGKTGETLVKTVLAPLFVARNLPVMSWEGLNMLGNRDGEVLRDAGSLASKVRDKDEALRRILRDDRVHSRVRIDYVPSLDDWKQAYDFIHFRGFLGARMQMHFLWQGCDSALAAPLVLDLVRLTDLAHRLGAAGPLPFLAPFFKTPLDCDVQDFAAQMHLFSTWCDEARAARES